MKKLNVVKLVKNISRNNIIIPPTKKFKNKKKYSRKQKHKGGYDD